MPKLLCPGDTIKLNPNVSNFQYLWSDNFTDSQFIVVKPQQVWLLLTDSLGCFYTDTIEIIYDDNCLDNDLVLPNIFSPNGDGINDYWGSQSVAGVRSMVVTIFDRWGGLLFKQDAEYFFWDGLSREGILSPPGVYTYLIKLIQKIKMSSSEQENLL